MSSKQNLILLVVNIALIAFLVIRNVPHSAEDDPELVQLLNQIRYSGKKTDTLLLGKLNVKIRAIWTQKCFQCHSSEKRKGELALDHYDGVLAGGEDGEILVKGKASESEIIRRLKLRRGVKHAMPPKGEALTTLQIHAIETWINHDAYWVDSTIKLFHEAPLTLVPPVIPKSDFTHTIDKFVDNYFSKHKVKWPKPISDQQFARKVYLDITGLLPSPSELNRFLHDTAVHKRDRLIQKLLLDNEKYTLHWMSFWNDLLRNDYSGTGFITGGRKQISSWLYQSLMDDSTYIQMVRSLLNPHPNSAGFIAGIQWRGEVNSSQSTEMQAAQNVSQSLLGLNLKCASCHNSFVNNLSLEQSYGFASVFAKEPLELHRCDVGIGIRAKPSFIYPQLGQISADSLKERLTELSNVVTSPDNGRLYRTLVNRIWAQLLGRGLVGKVDEMDLTPWSQDLLDFLATEFRANKTNIKSLLSLIMTSRIYQSTSMDYRSDDELNKPDFVFKGPAIRKMHAEQIADAISACVHPMYEGVSFDPKGYQIPAYWMWYPEKEFDRTILPQPDTAYFRRIIQLPEFTSATLLITADDQFECYLNENLITNGNDYREFQALNVLSKLKRGKNIFAIKAINTGKLPNPAGVLFHFRGVSINGDTMNLYSDSDWSVEKTVQNDGWKSLNYKDKKWPQIHRYGSYSGSYWGKLRRFNLDSCEIPVSSRAVLVSADPFLKALGRPTRENVTTKRSEEPGLLQAISLTNDPLLTQRINEGSEIWWNRYQKNPSQLIDQLFLNLLNRIPSNKEKLKMMEYYSIQPGVPAVADMIWVLIVSPEFQLI